MVDVNNTQVIDRHNRPTTLQKVLLRAFFINDGVYQDPYAISGVTIFRQASNQSPSTVLDTQELLTSALTSSQILMHFANSAIETSNTAAFRESNYTPGTTASGIYKLGVGKYAVVLDGSVDLSGHWNFHGSSLTIANGASAIGNHIDVWSVVQVQGSKLKTIINEFELFDDTFFTITQPLLFQVNSKMSPKKIVLGAKKKLKIGNELTILNETIDESIKNIFKDSIITSAMLEIKKVNEDNTLPARVSVSSFAQTSSVIDVTPDNTLTFDWDTDKLKTHPQVSGGDFGPLTGRYTVQAKFNLLDEVVKTPLFNLVVE